MTPGMITVRIKAIQKHLDLAQQFLNDGSPSAQIYASNQLSTLSTMAERLSGNILFELIPPELYEENDDA